MKKNTAGNSGRTAGQFARGNQYLIVKARKRRGGNCSWLLSQNSRCRCVAVVK